MTDSENNDGRRMREKEGRGRGGRGSLASHAMDLRPTYRAAVARSIITATGRNPFMAPVEEISRGRQESKIDTSCRSALRRAEER